ncbi:AAA family ATPase [Rhodococcus globerulus]|uniref:AAA family ATPase n=1 Tax=Rhodococcus globerulus TaxID=33008 RepID=UPI001C57FC06|nr:AAA family ATPase [Rhodococcus globerulus]QXW01952.1 ATP-binding protein [Rhodococcus globerulus]
MAGVDDKKLRKRFQDKKVDPVITEIRFPLYKALTPNLTINFSFPITALVGPNGSNKSSILHALYGSPGGKSLSDFWFSSAMDDIDSRSLKRANSDTLQRFIYKYRTHIGNRTIIAECRKARGSKPYRQSEIPKAFSNKKDPDYWETTKRVKYDGMAEIPTDDLGLVDHLSDTKTRWNAINKEVVYLDFRSELSAYDKYMYHAAYDRWTRIPNGKKFRVLNQALGLARSFNKEKTLADTTRIIEDVRELEPQIVEEISKILGKEFSSIKIIKHTFYSSIGYSAKLTLAGSEYSEAHAGSGEFAIVRLVDAISNMGENALLLLDEPEVSLHPGAQKYLLSYLKAQVIQKGTQIVISTHSPSIVEELPPDAIKLLGADPSTGDVSLISNETHHTNAFFHIGHVTGLTKKRIMVEDSLVKEVLLCAIRLNCTELLGTIDPVIFPGGSGNLIKYSIPALALSQSSDTVLLLDGDQRIENADWSLIDSLPTTPENRKNWEDLATSLLGCVPTHFADTRDSKVDDSSVAINLQTILKWSRQNVFYLDGKVPEAAILSETEGTSIDMSTAESKGRFVEIARTTYNLSQNEAVPARDILSAQRISLSKLGKDSPLLKSAFAAIEAIR